jgi:hypothetical protein
MPYTSDKPAVAHDPAYLRATIPGWGVDANPRDRPAVPKEQFVPRSAAGTHGAAFPERQIEKYEREKSTEHPFLTPVFGTACPPKGLSGIVRRFAYRRYSEGRSAHWLLLMLADRIDIVESMATAALRGQPDNPIAEMGLVAEFTGHGIRSRVGQHRADLKHLPVDVLMFGGKALLLGAALVGIGRFAFGRPRRRGLFA